MHKEIIAIISALIIIVFFGIGFNLVRDYLKDKSREPEQFYAGISLVCISFLFIYLFIHVSKYF
jgi:uncharacterized membrane protein